MARATVGDITVQRDQLADTADMYKLIALAAIVAVARAGYLGAPAYGAYAAPAYGGYAAPAYGGYAAPAAVTSQHANILRTPGNLGQVSTYSKTIDTPYSSVSKSDVRVSNDALAYGGYGGYAAPAAYASRAYAAPALAARAGLLGVAYSAALSSPT
ncbi:hypothetical protein PR048_024131 [Dryococelus australis]|uniref:Uncharacterized protein n=1 Tax=Dryococelus australis TaxID=614101 RepID=A0ABQ9GW13_9NEOP|nr:hypothetical protein PR048_024131 [Dryococelus australis]